MQVHHRLCLLTALFAVLGVSSFVQAQNTWQGPMNNKNAWSHGPNWSGGVPGPGHNVAIPQPFTGPTLDVHATIGSLTVGSNASVREIASNTTPHNLTVTGTTTLQGASDYDDSGELNAGTGSTFSLGTLANFSGGVLTGHYTCDDYDDEASRVPTVIQWHGANVIENRAYIDLYAADSAILDQDSGLHALRNLAINSGFINMDAVANHTVSGSLTNNNTLYIFNSYHATPFVFTVTNSFINNTDGDALVYGNAELRVQGNLINRASNQQLYAVNQADAPPGDAIIHVKGDFTNDKNAILIIDGEGGRNARLIVDGNMTNDGYLFLEGSGSMQVGGVLTVASGALILTADTVETFLMTAQRIDMAAGTQLGARGTMFCDLVENGIFYPGASPGQVTIKGDLTLGDTAILQIEIGGTAPGATYDRVVQETQTAGAGTVLDGTLAILFVNNFQTAIQNGQSFVVLTSDRSLVGQFNNVASGGRVQTADGAGSFQVDYAGTAVTLSAFQVSPPPVITSIPASGVPNGYATILGTGFIGTVDVQFNGMSTFFFNVDADNQISAYIPPGTTSGPITVITNHGNATSSTSFIVLTDSDGDGMSDDFEMQYFGDATSGEPDDDSGDTDGMTNLQEFLAGTHPSNPNSALRVRQIRRQGNDIVVVFPSAADKRYRLEASTTPLGDFPIKLGAALGAPANPARELSESNGATYAKRFYKVALLP